jgi:anthranilate phosphoribosyltransferase
MGLKTKGESAVGDRGRVKAALEEARLVPDLSATASTRGGGAGTGGDNTCSFNCSTAVALFFGRHGAQWSKHLTGTGPCPGLRSADAVEALGLRPGVEPTAVKASLDATNFSCLFSSPPATPPAFKRIGPYSRKNWARGTLFNLMGPLSRLLNPARPTHQILGVPTSRHVPLMAEVLALTGLKPRPCVWCTARRGFDELTAVRPGRCLLRARPCWLKGPHRSGGTSAFPPTRPPTWWFSGRGEAVSVLRGLLAGKGPAAMLT